MSPEVPALVSNTDLVKNTCLTVILQRLLVRCLLGVCILMSRVRLVWRRCLQVLCTLGRTYAFDVLLCGVV